MNRILGEDEEAILNLIKINLKENGYEYIGMTTCQETIDLVDYNNIDLVILDIMLSEMNSYERY